MEQYSRSNKNSVTSRALNSTGKNPFYLENMIIEGSTRKHHFFVFLFIIFTFSLIYWGWVWLTGHAPSDYFIMLIPLFSGFFIESLPLLAKHEIQINNKFIIFRSSLYNVSFDRNKITVSFKNANRRKYLRLLNKRVQNTNFFALIMSNIPFLIFLICGYIFLHFYTVCYNIPGNEQILLGLLFFAFSFSPYALLCHFTLEKSAHILILDNKKRIKIYALDPEWLEKQLVNEKIG